MFSQKPRIVNSIDSLLLEQGVSEDGKLVTSYYISLLEAADGTTFFGIEKGTYSLTGEQSLMNGAGDNSPIIIGDIYKIVDYQLTPLSPSKWLHKGAGDFMRQHGMMKPCHWVDCVEWMNLLTRESISIIGNTEWESFRDDSWGIVTFTATDIETDEEITTAFTVKEVLALATWMAEYVHPVGGV